MPNYRKILLKDFSEIREEFVAAGTITPGMLCEMTSAGKIQAHSVSGGNVGPVMVAIEDELQGKEITDDYATNALVQANILRPGDQFYGILADGQNVVIGDLLESDGAGKLTKHVVDSTGIYYHRAIVGRAMEAVDMSGSAGVDPSGRIVVMVA